MDYQTQGKVFNKLLMIFSMVMVFFVALVIAFYLDRIDCSISKLDQCLPRTMTDLALMGDYFGGMLGAVLGFFTLMFVLSTVVMQKRQLVVSREDKGLTQRELAGTSKALNAQHQIAQKNLLQATIWRVYDEFVSLTEQDVRRSLLKAEIEELLFEYENISGEDPVCHYFRSRLK